MRLALVVALLIPVLEIVVIVLVWHVIGWWTLLALALCFLAGVLVIRTASREALREVRSAMSSGRPPAPEVADAPQLVFGGVLLLIPGFITSALGLLLILPGMRSISRRLLQLMVARRVATAATAAGGTYAGHGGTGRGRESDIIEGEIIENDDSTARIIETTRADEDDR